MVILPPQLIPSWSDSRLTDGIGSGDVLIWSGGTGSGLLLITETGEAAQAIAFLVVGERGQSNGAPPHMKFIFNLYEL